MKPVASSRGATMMRASVLPAAALLGLLAGGLAFWMQGAPLATGIWFGALALTGAPVLIRTTIAVLRGHFATDVVAALAIGTALALREPLAGLVVVLMQTGGEALERYAEGRASAAVRALEDAAPRVAHRMSEGREDDIGVEAVAVGDSLVVRPGEVVPCDGEVVDGRSDVDTSRLTGEPLPRAVAPGASEAARPASAPHGAAEAAGGGAGRGPSNQPPGCEGCPCAVGA